MLDIKDLEEIKEYDSHRVFNMDTDSSELTTLLKRRRLHLRIPRQKLTRMLNVSDDTLRYWERGNYPSVTVKLLLWMQLLSFDISAFLNYKAYTNDFPRFNTTIPVVESITWKKGKIIIQYKRKDSDIELFDMVTCEVQPFEYYTFSFQYDYLSLKEGSFYVGYLPKMESLFDLEASCILWKAHLERINKIILEEDGNYFSFPILFLHLKRKRIEEGRLVVHYPDGNFEYYAEDADGMILKKNTFRILYFIRTNNLFNNHIRLSVNREMEKYNQKVNLTYIPYSR